MTVEEAHPDLSDAEKTFLTLRGAVFVARHAQLMEKYRHLYKREIIDNTEFGLKLTPREIVEAEIAQGELIRRAAKLFENYDMLICPGGDLPAVRRQPALSRRKWTASASRATWAGSS